MSIVYNIGTVVPRITQVKKKHQETIFPFREKNIRIIIMTIC